MPDTLTRGVGTAYPPAGDPGDAREAALRALAREIDGGAPRRSRRRLALAAATGAVAVTLAGAGVVRLVLPGDAGLPRADAATVAALETGARAAEGAPAAPVLGPGKYLYTRSSSVDQVTSVTGGTSTTYLVQHERQSWFNASGGRLVESGRPLRFLAGDRAFWESEVRRLQNTSPGTSRVSGLPSVSARFAEVGASDAALAERVDDPRGAAELLRDAAPRYGGAPRDQEMFVMVGDGLRETDFSPGARAALFRAAAYIEGVRSIGTVRDSRGRAGIGVTRESDGMREVLIFDPETSQLLEEQRRTTGPIDWLPGVPTGSLVGRSTYLVSAVVGSETATP
ncbi:MAG: CU044_5270 family protein [Thermoleophilia bacterium]|nr:CU044_5270 family protein [Thermoleophilia bacterium]